MQVLTVVGLSYPQVLWDLQLSKVSPVVGSTSSCREHQLQEHLELSGVIFVSPSTSYLAHCTSLKEVTACARLSLGACILESVIAVIRYLDQYHVVSDQSWLFLPEMHIDTSASWTEAA